MAHFIDGDPANFEVHFLHSAHPRHGFCVMSMNPVLYYEFQTPVGFRSTYTLVTNASGAILATFNWFGPSALGTLTWQGTSAQREAHMADLVMPTGSMPDSRAFLCEGPDQIMRLFWWHRLPHGNYDLYAAHNPDTVIGLFRKHQPPEVLPVGNNYATFYFGFSHEPLLFHALLALCLNRWLDSQERLAESA